MGRTSRAASSSSTRHHLHLEGNLTDAAALGERLLDQDGHGVVADVRHQGSRDDGVLIEQERSPLLVGDDSVDRHVLEHTCTGCEEFDRLQHRVGHHGHHHVEFEIAVGSAPRDGDVVAEYAGGDHHHRLRDDRVDLPRHDGRAGLERRKADLTDAVARAGRQPSKIVDDLEHRRRNGLQNTRGIHVGVLRRLCLEVVLRLAEGIPGPSAHDLDCSGGEALRSVDTRPDSGPAERQLQEVRESGLDPLDALAHLGGIAGELLTESNRRRILKVCPAGLQYVVELDSFGGEARLRELASRGASPPPSRRRPPRASRLG